MFGQYKVFIYSECFLKRIRKKVLKSNDYEESNFVYKIVIFCHFYELHFTLKRLLDNIFEDITKYGIKKLDVSLL